MNLTKASIDVLCHNITDLVNQHQIIIITVKVCTFSQQAFICVRFFKFSIPDLLHILAAVKVHICVKIICFYFTFSIHKLLSTPNFMAKIIEFMQF